MCEPPLGHGGGGIRLGLGIPARNANPAAPTQFTAQDLWAVSGAATYSSSLSGAGAGRPLLRSKRKLDSGAVDRIGWADRHAAHSPWLRHTHYGKHDRPAKG
jgi:hypothetical protein